MEKKKFTESNAKIPQAIFDVLNSKGIQVIGIQVGEAAHIEPNALKGCTIEIGALEQTGTKGGSITGADVDLVLRRPLTSAGQFLALKPAGDGGRDWGKVTALVEERVKSTLQGLEAMIKASDVHDAGARPELAQKKWDMRSQLGLRGLADPLACVAWEMGPEMDPILEEETETGKWGVQMGDRWRGDGEAPKLKRKPGCFSHSGQKRQRREEEEQLKDLIGSYTVKVVRIKEEEVPCMVATWVLSPTSKELLKEMSFQRMQRGEGKDVTVKLEGALEGSSSLKLTGEKETGNSPLEQENIIFSNSLMLGILCPEKDMILLCPADLFTTSVYRPPPENSEEDTKDKAYADQRRRVTEGFGTDKKVRQNNLMRERIERNCEVADSEKIQTMVEAKVAEQQEGKMSSWEKEKIARDKVLPPFLDDWDHVRDIYREGLEVIASAENIRSEKKLLDDRILPLLEMKAPELEKLDATKLNDLEACCDSHFVLQVLKARGAQGAKVPKDLNHFARQLGFLKILKDILQDRGLNHAPKRAGQCTPKQLAHITHLSSRSPLFWQLFYYLFDPIHGDDAEKKREIHKMRTQCAAVIWALNLIPDCWIDMPVEAQIEIACLSERSKSNPTDTTKKIFQYVGCTIEKKDHNSFRAALRNRPGQL
eukprot:s532_g16.t1